VTTTSGATSVTGASSVTVVVSSAKAAGAPKAVTPGIASVTAIRRRGVIVVIMSVSL
jgi:hypothetical protein